MLGPPVRRPNRDICGPLCNGVLVSRGVRGQWLAVRGVCWGGVGVAKIDIGRTQSG